MNSYLQFEPSYKIPLLIAIIFHCFIIYWVTRMIEPIGKMNCPIDVQLEFEVPKPQSNQMLDLQDNMTRNPETPTETISQSDVIMTDQKCPQTSLLLPPKLLYKKKSEDETKSKMDKFLPECLQEFRESLVSSLNEKTNRTSAPMNQKDEIKTLDAPLIKACENPLIPVRNTTGIQVKTIKFDFIPTPSQIHILDHLFRANQATQIELYASADSCNQWTYQQFQGCMDALFDKGWISREKISPEQIFNFFGLPIEMSLRNKKNPLYQYKPNISRQVLIRYIESHRQKVRDYQLYSKSDSLQFESQIQTFTNYLKTLVEL